MLLTHQLLLIMNDKTLMKNINQHFKCVFKVTLMEKNLLNFFNLILQNTLSSVIVAKLHSAKASSISVP